MNIDQADIIPIRTAFQGMQTKEELLELLNRAKPLVYGKKAVPYELKQLTWYANPKLGRTRYKEFKVLKKSGKEFRSIHAPVKGLKALQKTLGLVLQCVFEPHSSAMGFVRNRSIVDNARLHEGSRYVYNIDLKDFFPSIDQARVWKCFQLRPFNLVDIPERKKIADMLAAICCTELEVERKNDNGEWIKVKRNVLPQGAPTSPVITNIVCQRLDFLLAGVAKRFGLRYSRYADDITFSSMHNAYQVNGEFIKELHRIITEQGFQIKESKTRLQKDGYRKEVTGLLVNEKANVQKRYIKQLRMWLYYWERYGYQRASGFFLRQYITDRGHLKKGRPDMANVIAGKLDYLKMVKGEGNYTYKRLFERFIKVSFTNPFISNHSLESKKDKIYKQKIIIKEQELQLRDIEIEKKNTEIKELINASKELPKEVEKIIHDPILTVSLLNKFTNDTYLKYTTHIWDRNKETGEENIDRKSFQEKVIKELFAFQDLEKIGLKNFYFTLVYFISAGDEKRREWGSHKLKLGWNNAELKEFYLNNIDKQPGSFAVPEAYLPNEKIDGKYLKYFDDFIDVFKNEIEFRGNTLYYSIKKAFDEYLGFEYKVEYEGLKGISIYTCTKTIKETFQIIASNIRQRPEKDKHIKIEGKYYTEGKFYEIRIKDIGSFANVPLSTDKLMLTENKGQIGKLRDLLTSLCDFSIESDFRVDNNSYQGFELKYLTKNKKEILKTEEPFITSPVENPIGFTYILKFYE